MVLNRYIFYPNGYTHRVTNPLILLILYLILKPSAKKNGYNALKKRGKSMDKLFIDRGGT